VRGFCSRDEEHIEGVGVVDVAAKGRNQRPAPVAALQLRKITITVSGS
jgi:hypothetical protein